MLFLFGAGSVALPKTFDVGGSVVCFFSFAFFCAKLRNLAKLFCRFCCGSGLNDFLVSWVIAVPSFDSILS